MRKPYTYGVAREYLIPLGISQYRLAKETEVRIHRFETPAGKSPTGKAPTTRRRSRTVKSLTEAC